MDLLVGCDPEIVFTDKNNVLIPAHTILTKNKTVAFGCDGHPPICELRPGVASTPFEMIARIKNVFEQAYTKGLDFKNGTLTQLNWLAGHYKKNKPLGGHIHFAGVTSSKIRTIVQNLDIYIELLSELIDPKEEKRKRRNNGAPHHNGGGNVYGNLGDYRTKGTNHFEYRTPGSWLLSPQVSYLYIALAYNIVIGTEIGEIKTIDTPFEANVTITPQNLNKICTTLRNATTNEEKLGLIIQLSEKNFFQDKKVFLTVLEKTINSLPLKWNDDIKEYWI